MKSTIIKIGNSTGSRIPKPVFEQCGFKAVRDGDLIIRSSAKPREGWEEAFKAMAEESSPWDHEEWEWQ